MPSDEKAAQGRPSTARVQIREDTSDGIRIRRRLTQPRAPGGVVVFLLFAGCLLAGGFVIVMPEVRPVAAALVLVLSVFAASPELHDWLHHGDAPTAGDHCAVVLFASGVSLALDAPFVVPPSAVQHREPRALVREIFLASPRYLRQPERGPPVG